MQSYTPKFLWRSPKTPNSMSSSYETPQQNGNGLQDPFTDEKNGDHKQGNDRPRTNGNGDRDDDGEKTPTLFYAYARRVRFFSVPLLHLPRALLYSISNPLAHPTQITEHPH